MSFPTATPSSLDLFGPRLERGGGVTFRLWAPGVRRVEVLLEQIVPNSAHGSAFDIVEATATGRGWFEAYVARARDGTRYLFRINGELQVPDPASGFQPEDVSGPSEVVDYDCSSASVESLEAASSTSASSPPAGSAPPGLTSSWQGLPWEEAAILELHVGTFTAEGTFRGVISKLPEIAAAGFTAIELMPVGDFSGRRNWGYDGVLWFAPDHTYGTPADLRALVDAAHDHGLMIFLDVVYNHFGPEGNYLSAYAPAFFTSAQQTPWGDAIDYRVPEVRAFAVQNALHWLSHYGFDGLRLDAVHAITESGEPHILHDISIAVGQLAAASGRLIHLVLENDDNIAGLLEPGQEPARGRYRAQWNDDYHHCWHVLLTRERSGYYSHYADQPLCRLRRSLAEGYVYQGEMVAGRNRGEDSSALPPLAFVNFLQNHDQIGNRALGERLEVLAPTRALQAALVITLLAPMPPLLFMGEEWGARQPFPFFCDFAGELGEAVRAGRRREFASLFESLPKDKSIPDPLAAETFRSAVLEWEERNRSPYRERLLLVKRLLEIRRQEIVPRLRGLGGHAAKIQNAARAANVPNDREAHDPDANDREAGHQEIGHREAGAWEAGDLEGAGNTTDNLIDMYWNLNDGSRLRLIANLQDQAVEVPIAVYGQASPLDYSGGKPEAGKRAGGPAGGIRVLWQGLKGCGEEAGGSPADELWLAGWAVHWQLEGV